MTLFLPWTEVFVVTVGKTFGHVELCARPVNRSLDAQFAPRVWAGGGEARVGQEFACGWVYQKLGTNVHSPLTGADHSVDEVLARLRHYAAGRCRFG